MAMILPDRNPPRGEFDVFRAGAIIEYEGRRYMVSRLTLTESGYPFAPETDIYVTMILRYVDDGRTATVLAPEVGNTHFLRTSDHRYAMISGESSPDYLRVRLMHVWHPGCGESSEA